MKKVISFCLAAMFLFSGCQNNEQQSDANSAGTTSETTSNGGTENKDGKLKLVIWGGVDAVSGPQDLIDAYMAKNPNVEVEYVRFVNDDPGNVKLDTALLSGEQIDLYFTYSPDMVRQRADGGMALNLNEFGAKDFIVENMGEDGVFAVDGEYFSMPTCSEPAGIMVNLDMFEKAGIEVPKQWTFDELKEIAKKLTGEYNGKQVYGFYPYHYGLLELSRMAIGDNFLYKSPTESNFDNPAFKNDSLTYDMMYTDKSAYPYEQILAQKHDGVGCNSFLQGDVAMAVFSSWMARRMSNTEQFPRDFKVAFAPMPTVGTDDYSIGARNNFLMINSQTKNKEAAWDLLKFWVTEGSQYMFKAGKVPVTKEYDKDKFIEVVCGAEADKLYDIESFRAFLDIPFKYPNDTLSTAMPEIKQIRKEETDKLLLQQQSYDEFLTNAKTRCDEVIAKANN